MGEGKTTGHPGKHEPGKGSAPHGDPKPVAGGDWARRLSFDLSTKTMGVLVLVGVSFWLLVRLWPVLLVLVVALLVSGTLSPAVRWLEQRRIKRGLGIALVFGFLFVIAPDFLAPMFDRKVAIAGIPAGMILIGMGLFSMFIGFMLIRKIVDIEV